MNPFEELRSRIARRVMSSIPPRLAARFEDGDYAIGIGPAVGAGALLGGSLGGGVLLHRGGIGYYGSVGLAAGLLGGLSAGLHVTVVRGGAEAFLGLAHAVAVTVTPAFTGVTVLYTPAHDFLGVSLAAAIGSALPLELYVGALKTYGRG